MVASEQQNVHPNPNTILSSVLIAWVVKHPDLEQPPNMVAYYRLGALILNEILEIKDIDPIKFENQKQLFTSVPWVNVNDAESAALVERVNNGNQTVPTLVFTDGTSMTNPSLAKIKEHLNK